MTQNNHITQGYKSSSLGFIPENWEVKRLGEFSTFFSGGTPKSDNAQYYNGNIPFIRSGEINRDKTGLFLSQEGFENSSAKIVEEGDLLYALYGANSGQCSLSKINGAINQAILCIRPNKADRYYIMSVLQKNKEHYCNSYLQGGQGNLSGEIVSNYKIAVPPIEEQKKIAEVLSEWDKAIELQTKLIEKLELRKRALMQRLLTGRVRLNGFSGKWEKVKAGEVFYNSSKRSAIGEQLLSATQEYGVIPRDMLDTRVTMPSEISVENFKLVEQGDFIISLRSFQGGIEYSHYRGCISPAYTVLKTKHTINDTFYQYYFKSTDFICRLAVAVIGIRDGRQISFNDFCYVKIPEPSLSEQIAIAERLITADKEIEIAKTKLTSFHNQKRGLMQQLLTGKKRII